MLKTLMKIERLTTNEGLTELMLQKLGQIALWPFRGSHPKVDTDK